MAEPDKETWIRVNTSPGMFSSEYAISLRLADGREVTFFADKQLVRSEEDRDFLKVTLVNSYPGLHKKLVLLPSEAFETASRWAEVTTNKE